MCRIFVLNWVLTYKCRLYQFLLHLFFVNTYDTVHNVLIKIHIVFTIAYNTHMELAENFYSQKSVIARKRSVTAKRPRSPPQKKTGWAAKPILACFYKTLTMGARRSCGQSIASMKPLDQSPAFPDKERLGLRVPLTHKSTQPALIYI